MATEDGVRPAYRWAELLPTDEPSRELVAAVSGADVRYFTANVVGSENGKEWQTSSWVELAYRNVDGGFRAVWKSGGSDTPKLPGAIFGDWSTAPSRDDAIALFFDRQHAAGFPLVGVCELMKVRNGTRGYRDAPMVHGYELPLP
ncbi:hypothetical protein N7E02_07095 (plasmid) [Aliirhizobium terrae]|uniref:hypothetical protein n=1 Tax=Terrirhizobium terrae TaxID=2926709 RepID=UPI00257828A2|nr:hypothetical protein [Rhizobium sp. CC-CFT758]WJH38396.1 hypothetical protein N7E02_07095 [Rhizobium sp. CC-CFT758]